MTFPSNDGADRISPRCGDDSGSRTQWFSLQQSPQSFAGLVKLRFRATRRASQKSRDLVMLVSKDVVQQEELLVTTRQLADRTLEV